MPFHTMNSSFPISDFNFYHVLSILLFANILKVDESKISLFCTELKYGINHLHTCVLVFTTKSQLHVAQNTLQCSKVANII